MQVTHDVDTCLPIQSKTCIVKRNVNVHAVLCHVDVLIQYSVESHEGASLSTAKTVRYAYVVLSLYLGVWTIVSPFFRVLKRRLSSLFM